MKGVCPNHKTNANKRVDSTSEVLTSFINEEKERYKRRLNLIVHNVLESSADNGSERKSHDINTVTSIFEKYWGVKVKITNANRIGRKKEGQLRPRLTKVSVESEHEKAVMLHNCTKLRARDIREEIQNVYITPDLTPREQQHNKVLRAQLAERNKDGKKYWIKTEGLCRGGVNTSPLRGVNTSPLHMYYAPQHFYFNIPELFSTHHFYFNIPELFYDKRTKYFEQTV